MDYVFFLQESKPFQYYVFQNKMLALTTNYDQVLNLLMWSFDNFIITSKSILQVNSCDHMWWHYSLWHNALHLEVYSWRFKKTDWEVFHYFFSRVKYRYIITFTSNKIRQVGRRSSKTETGLMTHHRHQQCSLQRKHNRPRSPTEPKPLCKHALARVHDHMLTGDCAQTKGLIYTACEKGKNKSSIFVALDTTGIVCCVSSGLTCKSFAQTGNSTPQTLILCIVMCQQNADCVILTLSIHGCLLLRTISVCLGQFCTGCVV